MTYSLIQYQFILWESIECRKMDTLKTSQKNKGSSKIMEKLKTESFSWINCNFKLCLFLRWEARSTQNLSIKTVNQFLFLWPSLCSHQTPVDEKIPLCIIFSSSQRQVLEMHFGLVDTLDTLSSFH